MFQIGSINRKFNRETETFRYSFHLTHQGDPIFLKSFDGSNPDKVLLGADTIVLKNHFYVTGEELEYFANDTAIGIDHTSTGVGAATTIPQTVYAIKVDEDKIKLAATPALAKAGTHIGLTTVGIGNSHYFTANKQNTKVIMALDNIIQSPLTEEVGAATTLSGMLNKVISFWDISGFKSYDLIKIDDEIMRIQVVGYNGIANDALVDREWLGTKPTLHINGASIKKVKGDYNIVKDKVTFVDVPFGGIKVTVGVSSDQVNVQRNSFRAISDYLETGSEVLVRSINPPVPLIGNETYFLIKEANNEFSFAETKGDALTGVGITLTTAGIGTHNFIFVDTSNGSSFQGRSFIRSDYTGNLVIDDISDSFTGIAKTFTIKSGGSNTTGITSDFGSLLINNIFQKPEIDYDFIGGSSTGITSIRFTNNSSNTTSLTDVNANRVPRKGLIVSLASSEGFGYQERLVGTGTAVVASTGVISSVGLGFSGTGYRNTPTTYRFNIIGGGSVVGASGTFSVANGNISAVDLTDAGSGFYYKDVSNVAYNHLTGITTVTTGSAHGLTSGNTVKLSGIAFTCTYSASKTISNAVYDNTSGIMTVTTTANHGLSIGQGVILSGIGMTCQLDGGASTKTYPRTTDPYYAGSIIAAVPGVKKLTVQVGPSTVPTFYKTGGRLQGALIGPRFGDLNAEGASVTVVDNTTFEYPAGVTTAHHWYARGGSVTKPIIVDFDSPIGYDDIQLISASTGIGASVSLNVGTGLSITSFDLNNVGYGFTVGEQLRIAGIPTNTSIGSTFRNAIFTVKETRDDEFAGWVFGKVQVLDNFSDQFDGRKRVFTITENSEPLSIEKNPGTLISLQDNLLVFLNDIIQHPGVSYVFNGGTQIEFTEPPVEGTTLQIMLYRGTDSDVAVEGALQTVKVGDSIKINKNNDFITPVSQNERIVDAITSRDTLRTTVYTKQGISNQLSPLRPVVWCKQQDDLIVEGAPVSKARDMYAAKVKPAARIIQSASTTDNTFYTGSGALVFSKTEQPDVSTFGIQIVDTDKNNTGFGTTTFINPVETISGVSVSGDDGIITGIGTTAQGIQFNFHIPLNSTWRDNTLGGLTKTGIATGDFFLVSRSNVGNGVTALLKDRTVAISSCSDLIDTVFQVSHIEDITPVGTASSVRVHVNVETGHGLNFTGLGSGVGNYYGNFSWAKFSSSRSVGLAFTCNSSDGLSGLSTAPTIIRTTKLSLDYS